MRLLPALALALLLVALPHAHAASADSVDVLVPVLDPHLDAGYVDVYAHRCPLVTLDAAEPCRTQFVARVELP